MENRPAFFRGIVVGVLAMMVVRSVVWLATPSDHPDATTARYALNVANILICGGNGLVHGDAQRAHGRETRLG